MSPPPAPSLLSPQRKANNFSWSSSSNDRIKASGAKLPASTTNATTKDDWALIVAYEAEKERKEGEGRCFVSNGREKKKEKNEKTKPFRLLKKDLPF